MKTFKKALCLILSLMILLTCAAPAFAADAADLTFNCVSNSYYRITGCSPFAAGDLVIPATYNGLPVTEIKASAFEGCGLESVTLPESIERIGDKAFYNSSIESVEFKGTDVNLGSSVFSYCFNLSSVILPSALKKLPDSTFFNCRALSDISFPATLTTISENAFNCSGLTSAVIPASVTSIGAEAFAACENLTSITVDAANTKYKSVDGVLFTKDGTSLLQYPCASDTKIYTIPDGVVTVAKTSFAKTDSLQIVYFADSVKTVESYAFSECKALSGVFLNDSIETLQSLSFQRCPSLMEIVIPASVTSFEGAFYLSGLITATIENGVKEISASAFDSCGKLTQVVIPESVTAIKNGAFRNCTALKSIKIPAAVTTINNNAFVNVTDSVVLEVEENSAAHKYAIRKQMNFRIGDDVYYYVTFNSGDGSFADGTKTIVIPSAAGKALNTPANPVHPDGNSFKSWSPAIPGTMPAENLEFTATFSSYMCQDCNTQFGTKAEYDEHVAFENAKKAVRISIARNTGAKEIKYGETLRLTAEVTNEIKPMQILWYVDGEFKSEGNTFDIKFDSGSKTVTVKAADGEGNVLTDADGNEISSSETVTVKAGFFQKLISFFKNLFRMDRLIIQ